MEGFSRRLRKDMTGVMQEVFGKKWHSAMVPGWIGEGGVVKPAHYCGCQE